MFRNAAPADAYAAVKAELRRIGWRLGNASPGAPKPSMQSYAILEKRTSPVVYGQLFSYTHTQSLSKDQSSALWRNDNSVVVFLTWTLHMATAGQSTQLRKTHAKVQMHLSSD